MELKSALEQLRKEKKRKFSQSIDLIVNLKGLDLKRENINFIITLPHKIKDKKVCGFLDKKSDLLDVISKPEFPKYKDKKQLKNLVKSYDFFIASAPLMPTIATTFGKILGPAGKMPSPQLGILTQETEDNIKQTLEKISHSIKVRVKEVSIKLNIGKDLMQDSLIIENVKEAYKEIVNALPKKKDNIRSIIIKFTMTKPIKIELS